MPVSISSTLYEKLLGLAGEMNSEAGKDSADGNDVDLLVEIILKRALGVEPLMDYVETEYLAGPEEDVEKCPSCGEDLGEGFTSHTLDAVVCYGCRFDGDNP